MISQSDWLITGEWLTANRLTHFSMIIEMMAAENT